MSSFVPRVTSFKSPTLEGPDRLGIDLLFGRFRGGKAKLPENSGSLPLSQVSCLRFVDRVLSNLVTGLLMASNGSNTVQAFFDEDLHYKLTVHLLLNVFNEELN